MTNKLDTAMWLSRLFTVYCSALFVLPLLGAKGSNSLPLLRSILDKLSANQQNILKFIACNEIFLMPATVFMLFSLVKGVCSSLLSTIDFLLFGIPLEEIHIVGPCSMN
ncbi:transmembrane protein 33 isoform X1 [Prionailurus iriomotensis]